jgi:hypothetical protein
MAITLTVGLGLVMGFLMVVWRRTPRQFRIHIFGGYFVSLSAMYGATFSMNGIPLRFDPVLLIGVCVLATIFYGAGFAVGRLVGLRVR